MNKSLFLTRIIIKINTIWSLIQCLFDVSTVPTMSSVDDIFINVLILKYKSVIIFEVIQ